MFVEHQAGSRIWGGKYMLCFQPNRRWLIRLSIEEHAARLKKWQLENVFTLELAIQPFGSPREPILGVGSAQAYWYLRWMISDPLSELLGNRVLILRPADSLVQVRSPQQEREENSKNATESRAYANTNFPRYQQPRRSKVWRATRCRWASQVCNDSSATRVLRVCRAEAV